MWFSDPNHPLRRLFAGLTEQTFQTTLGVADPRLTDYLSGLLSLYTLMPSIVWPEPTGGGSRKWPK